MAINYINDYFAEGKKILEETEEATKGLKVKYEQLGVALDYAHEHLRRIANDRIKVEEEIERLDQEAKAPYEQKARDMKQLLAYAFTDAGDAFAYLDWFVKDAHPRMTQGSKHYMREYKRIYEDKVGCHIYLYDDPVEATKSYMVKYRAAEAFASDILNIGGGKMDKEQHARFLKHYEQFLADNFNGMMEAYLEGVPMKDLMA